MATKPKTTTPIIAADATPLLDQTAAAASIDPAQIAAQAEAIAAAVHTQRRAILAQLAQATQLPEADLLILFGLPA